MQSIHSSRSSRFGRLLASARRIAAGLLCFIAVHSAAEAACPCTIWPDTAVPGNASVGDTGAVELGVRFTADTGGVITGVRFYKGAANTGTHIGNLWTAGGTLLATATFANESASGWQQVNFASPVAITANTTYVASYYAPNGRYAADNQFFATQGVVNAPLTAPASGASGNGVFAYGAQSGFPASSFQSTNYWVDVVFEAAATPPPAVSGSGPVLLITADAIPFTKYYAEILRAEGLNAFATADIGAVTNTLLAAHDVAILGQMPLTQAQADLFAAWVNAGGNLIAMRPDPKLAGLLGVTALGTTLADQYLLVNTASGPGVGIVGQTIQFHDAADRYALNGATAIATLYSDTVTATANPAVTWRNVGTGRAAAFTYDLAKSVVFTRQGNPAWAGQERDGQPAIRPNDLFFPDYVNLDKVAIPQADEQQRLLANLIVQMGMNKKPMPRFWYLPGGAKAAIVHTLDDHNTGSGTRDTFDKLLLASPSGCVVEDWACYRATLWAFGNISLTDTQAAAYHAQGFELGAHVDTGCTVNFTSFANLDASYAAQLPAFRAQYPSLPAQATHRVHCLVWSDWLTQARVELSRGIRYSMDYYYWPDTWVAGRAGLFTGSGFPMRFADTDGTAIDIYQGVSQLVNENGLAYPSATNAMLDRALGAEGYYGLFGTHDDYRDTAFLDNIVAAAASRGVPIISAQQALTWLDGRNASTFDAISWSGNTLAFGITAATGARNLRAMLPANTATNALNALTRNGTPVAFTLQTVKGISYAFFEAANGAYQATYAGALPPPPNPPGEFTLWPANATPAIASVADPSAVELGVKFTVERDGVISGIRFYKGAANTGTHTANLWSSTGTLLASALYVNETATGWQQVNFSSPVPVTANTLYVASYHTTSGNYAADNGYFASAGVDNAPLHAPSASAPGGNGVYAYGASAFPSQTYQATNYWVDAVFKDVLPDTLWADSALPANPSFADPNAVELGVKFQASVNGKIKGIRFYKGIGNTGTHVGNLWSTSGALLATATFGTETASGWQQVLFATPVPIVAGVTYVASYYAPNGGYAVDANYFASARTSGALTALASAASGGNGVFLYGPSGFPQSSFNAGNYWVDVIFQRD